MSWFVLTEDSEDCLQGGAVALQRSLTNPSEFGLRMRKRCPVTARWHQQYTGKVRWLELSTTTSTCYTILAMFDVGLIVYQSGRTTSRVTYYVWSSPPKSLHSESPETDTCSLSSQMQLS